MLMITWNIPGCRPGPSSLLPPAQQISNIPQFPVRAARAALVLMPDRQVRLTSYWPAQASLATFLISKNKTILGCLLRFPACCVKLIC